MTEIDKLLVENLLEALRQIQSYLVLAFGASGSALALAITLWKLEKRQKAASEPSKKQEPEPAPELTKVDVSGVSVSLDPLIAQLVFLTLTVVAGLMAGFTAHSAMVIAAQLRSVHGLLEAAATFPSTATSPYWAVRFIPVLLPPFFACVAAYIELRREKAPGTAFGTWAVLIIAPYILLGLALHRPGWAL